MKNIFFNANLILTILTFLLCTIQTLAQGDSLRTIEDVSIVTRYEPNVADAFKVEITPSLREPQYQPPVFTYDFSNLVFRPRAVYAPADAILLRAEREAPLKDNYIRMAGGNYLTGILDARYFNHDGRNMNYGVNFNHHSANLSNNPERGTFNRNKISAFGERTSNATVRGEILFDRNAIHYYGADSIGEWPTDTSRQIYNMAGAKFSILELGSRRVSTSFLGDVYFMSSRNANELWVEGKNILEIELLRNQKITNIFALSYNNISRDSSLNRFFVDISPSYNFEFGRIDLNLGLNFNFAGENDNNEAYIAPNIVASTFLIPKKVKAYGGITGGLIKNTMQSMIYQNVFLNETFLLKNSMERFNIFLGMEGKLNKVFEYGLHISQNRITDAVFFVNDTNIFRNFTTLYDNLNTFNFNGRIIFSVNNKINIGGKFNVYSYSLNDEQEAWHLPNFDANIFANFQVANKIYINANFYHIGVRQARDLSSQSFDIGGINDLSLAAEYRYKKNISFFARGNNLFNQRYALWNHYVSQGLNAIIGFTLTL